MSENNRIAALASRAEQIKTNSAEYLWICRGVKLLPDKLVVADTNVDPEQRQLQSRLPCGAAPLV